MDAKSTIMMLLGLISSLAIAVSGFSLKYAYDSHAESAVMRAEINQMKTENDREVSQDRQIKMQWKYVSWLHGQQDEVRFKVGMSPSGQPKLD